MNVIRWLGAVVVCALAAAGTWLLGLGDVLRRREKQRAREELADTLKQKVAALHEQRAAERHEAAVAAAAIQQEADVAKTSDTVDVANALIADAKADRP